MEAQKFESEERVYLNSLSNEEKQSFYRDVYNRDNGYKRTFRDDFTELDCSKFANLFRDKISQVLIDKNVIDQKVELEQLHEHIGVNLKSYDLNFGINEISNLFYKIDEEFEEMYLKFVKEYVAEQVVKEPFYFQLIPTIRLHCPDAENSHHYPRYHTDIGYGHPPSIINLWLPLTKPVGEQKHGFSLMDFENSKKLFEAENYDFEALISKAVNSKEFNKECAELSEEAATEFGNIMVFDPRCLHTGEPMIAHTRVSIDIRIIKVEDFEKSNIIFQGAGRTKALFAPGHCYSDLTSKDL